jgi:tetratricopeptide (TPR) repeat protein
MIPERTLRTAAQRLGFLLAASALSATAFAEPPSESALAEALFREAKELMAEARYAEACPKLAESQRLDPGSGTLLNLAVCHEKEGRTATAWAEYHEALSVARREGRRDRQAFAEEHLKALEPALARVRVVLKGERPEGCAVRLGGLDLGMGALGSAVPVDPGEVLVEATAPGRSPWVRRYMASPSTTLRVEVALSPANDVTRDHSARSESMPSAGRPLAGYALLGLGAAGLAVGGYYGVRAISLRRASDRECVNGCSAQGVSLNDDARSAAWGSNVAIGAGLLAGALGAYFVWFSPARDDGETSEGVALTLEVLETGGAVGALGRF